MLLYYDVKNLHFGETTLHNTGIVHRNYCIALFLQSHQTAFHNHSHKIVQTHL